MFRLTATLIFEMYKYHLVCIEDKKGLIDEVVILQEAIYVKSRYR